MNVGFCACLCCGEGIPTEGPSQQPGKRVRNSLTSSQAAVDSGGELGGKKGKKSHTHDPQKTNQSWAEPAASRYLTL